MAESLCDLCGERPASVRFTEIKDNQKSEMNLCEECAREKGLGLHIKTGKVEFGVSDILAGMVEEEAEAEAAGSLSCPSCSLTFGEFKKVGRLGCGSCYDAFHRQMGPLLRRIHGSSSHVGKAPSGSDSVLERRMELRQKRAALAAAVEREDFEEAARLRDECRAMEEELGAEGADAAKRERA